MKMLSYYFNPDLGERFANGLPELMNQIGKISFINRDSSYGVAGNTFRAYRGYEARPSQLYQEWAESICNEFSIPMLKKQLRTREGFLVWHTYLAESLQQQWIRREGLSLSVAHKYKLVDLFIKWLSGHDLGSSVLSKYLVTHANCALDSQSLSKLNECLSFALPLSNPSMGDIQSEATYQFCQELIERFSTHFGGSPLLFDYFAWKKGGNT